MNLNLIDLEANTRYEAEARMKAGDGVINYTAISFTTDKQRIVTAFNDGITNNPDVWDYMKLKNKRLGKVLDLRLHTAAMTGDLRLAEEALASKVDVNLQSVKQRGTPLHWACAQGHMDVVKTLIAHGADVNRTDEIGCTPIILAAQGQHLNIIYLLRDHGANLKATMNGEEVFIDEGILNDPMGEDWNSVLLEAAEKGDFSSVKEALEKGADINCTTPDDWTALLACANCNSLITQHLLAHGADPNIASDKGYTPLMRAAGHGMVDTTKLLLAAGADPLFRDCNGKTAAQLALEARQIECAKLVNKLPEPADGKKGNKIIALSDAELSIVNMSRSTVGGTVRYVDITFSDGINKRCECIDEMNAVIPANYSRDDIDKTAIPLDQSSPAEVSLGVAQAAKHRIAGKLKTLFNRAKT